MINERFWIQVHRVDDKLAHIRSYGCIGGISKSLYGSVISVIKTDHIQKFIDHAMWKRFFINVKIRRELLVGKCIGRKVVLQDFSHYIDFLHILEAKISVQHQITYCIKTGEYQRKYKDTKRHEPGLLWFTLPKEPVENKRSKKKWNQQK